MTSFEENDGAVPGTHTVTVVKPKPSSGEEMSAENPGAAYGEAMRKAAKKGTAIESELPVKYATPDKSGITKEVVAGQENNFTIELE